MAGEIARAGSRSVGLFDLYVYQFSLALNRSTVPGLKRTGAPLHGQLPGAQSGWKARAPKFKSPEVTKCWKLVQLTGQFCFQAQDLGFEIPHLGVLILPKISCETPGLQLVLFIVIHMVANWRVSDFSSEAYKEGNAATCFLRTFCFCAGFCLFASPILVFLSSIAGYAGIPEASFIVRIIAFLSLAAYASWPHCGWLWVAALATTLRLAREESQGPDCEWQLVHIE
jgi:hypothetical protein